MADTVVGTVYGRDGPIAVPARGSVNLPQGVAGFALAQRHGPPELLLIVPPELEVQVGGVRSRTAARVPRGQAFVLTSDDGASAEYRFCGISTRATSRWSCAGLAQQSAARTAARRGSASTASSVSRSPNDPGQRPSHGCPLAL
jgi:hypothetical protein